MTEAGGIAKSLTCFNEDPHFQRVMPELRAAEPLTLTALQ